MLKRTFITLLYLFALSCKLTFGQINLTVFPSTPNKGSIVRLEVSIPSATLLSPVSCLKPDKDNVVLLYVDQIDILKADSIKIVSNQALHAYFKIPESAKEGDYHAVLGYGTACELYTDNTVSISSPSILPFTSAANLGKKKVIYILTKNVDPQNTLYIQSLKSLYFIDKTSGKVITPDSIQIAKNLAGANIYLTIPPNALEGKYDIAIPNHKYKIEALSGSIYLSMTEYRINNIDENYHITLPGKKITYNIEGDFGDKLSCNYPTTTNVFLVNKKSGVHYPVSNIVNNFYSFAAEVSFPLDTGIYYLSLGNRDICPATTENLQYLPMFSVHQELEVGDTVNIYGHIQPVLNALNITLEELSINTTGYLINAKNTRIPVNKFHYDLGREFKAEIFLPITTDSGTYRLVLQSKYFNEDLVSNGINVKYLKLESTNNVRIQVPALKSGVHRDSIYLGSSTILYGFTTPLCLSPENVYLVNSANEQIIRIEDFGTNKRYNDHFIYGYFSVNGTTVPGKYIPKNLDKNCHILFDTTNRYLEVLPPTLKTDIKSYRGYTGQKGLSIPLNNLHDLLDKGCFNLADIKIKHTSTNFIVTPKSVIAKDQWTHEMTFDIPLSADTGKYGLHIRYDTLKCNVYKDETDIFITPPYFVGIVQCGEIDFTKPSVCAVVNDTVNIGISGNEFQDSLYYPKAEYFQLKNLISNKVIPAFNVREDRYSPSIQFLSHNAEPGQYELQVNYPGKRVMVIPLVVAIAPPKIDLLTGYSFDQKNSIYSFEDRKDTLHVYAAGFNFKDPEDCFFLDSLKVYLFDSTTNAKIFPDKLLYKNHREFDFVFTSNEDHDNISFRLIFEGAQCRVQCRTKVIIQKRTEYYYHTNLQKGRTSWFSLSLRSHDFTDITSCYYTKVGMATIVDSLGNKYAALDSFEPSGSSIRPQEMTFDVKIPDNLDLSKKYFFNYRTPAECVLGSFRVPISISPPVFSTDTLAYKPYLAVKVYSDSSFLNPKSCFYPTKGNTILATKDSLNKSITYQADSIRFLPKALNPYYEYFTAYFTIPSDDPEFRYQAHATIARQKHTLISGSGNCRFNADVWVMSRGININKKSLNPAVKEFVSVKGISTDFTNKNSCTYISNNVKLKHIYLPLEIVPEKVTVLSEHFFQMQIAPQPERVGGFYNVVVSDSSSTCRLVSDSMIYLAKGQDVATYMTVLSRSRPQRDVIYQVDLKNNGTETMSGTNVLSYSQAQLSYKSITGIQGFSYPDSIVVPYKDLLPGANFSYRITFKVNASLGDSIKVISKVGPLEKDVFLTDNTYHLKQLVTGSFDPNDKQVYPESDISPTEITDGLDLVYTIRFQNMGNDTAFLIIVKDVINPLLEINSFEMISSSHPFDLSVKDRTMTWTFDNVLLPDNKTNEPGSHGFIKFKIKPKKNISLGDEINNNAAIYFDTNPPVVTNSTKNTVQVVVNGIAKPIKRDVSIYPNPVNRELFIVPSSHDEKLVAIKIYNTLGKELILGYSIDLENNRIVFNNIPTGFYMIKATTGINTYFKTFIIER